MLGKRYDKLILIEQTDKVCANKLYPEIWKAKCECGNVEELSIAIIRYRRLRHKEAKCNVCLFAVCAICDKKFDALGTKSKACSEECRVLLKRKWDDERYAKNRVEIRASRNKYREAHARTALKYYHEHQKGNPEYLLKKRPMQRKSYHKATSDPEKYQHMLEKSRGYKRKHKQMKMLADFKKISHELLTRIEEGANAKCK